MRLDRVLVLAKLSEGERRVVQRTLDVRVLRAKGPFPNLPPLLILLERLGVLALFLK
jgi:hypothetical protein